MRKRFLATLLALAMVLSVTPFALATDGENTPSTPAATELPDAKDGVITLTENVNLEKGVSIVNNDLVIDLNGYTITYTGTPTKATAFFNVEASRSLTVRDSKSGGAIIVNEDYCREENNASTSSTVRCVQVRAGGTFTLESGTLQNTNTASEATAVIINFGTVNINGGAVKGVTGIINNAPVLANAEWADQVSTCNINGGLIEGTECKSYISSGTYTPVSDGEGWSWGVALFGPGFGEDGTDTVSYDEVVLNMNGGTIKAGQGICTNASSGRYAGNTINIYDGTIEGVGDSGAAMYLPAIGKTTINGGTIQGVQGIRICAGELTINGGAINGTAALSPNADLVSGGSGGTEGAIVIGKAGTGYVGNIVVNISENATVQNTATTGDVKPAIVVSDKNMALTTDQNINNPSGNKTDATFDYSESGITVNVDGAIITGDVVKVSNLSGNDTQDGGNTSLVIENATVTGNVSNQSKTGLTVKDSTITGDVTNTSVGSTALLNTKVDGEVKDGEGAGSIYNDSDPVQTSNAVAINETTSKTYTTLTDALDAANDGNTITLLADITKNNYGTADNTKGDTMLYVDKSVTIAGNGKSITLNIPDTFDNDDQAIGVAAGKTLTLDGVTLSVTGGGEGKRGDGFDVWGTATLKITNGSNVTLTGLRSAFTMQGGDSAKLVVEDSTVTANDIHGNVTNGGAVTFDDATVKIDGCDSYGISANTITTTGKTTITADDVKYSAIYGYTEITFNEGTQVTVTNCTPEFYFSTGNYGDAKAPIQLKVKHKDGDSATNYTEVPLNEAAKLTVAEGATVTVSGSEAGIYLPSNVTYTNDGVVNAKVEMAEASSGFYTITVKDGDTVLSVTRIETTSGEYTLPAAPAKSGYTFQGWQDEAGNTYEAGAEVTGINDDMTFTAQWLYIPPVKPSYPVTLPAVTGGKVTASPAAAVAGATVTLTVVPDEGYELASLTVTDYLGNQIALSGSGSRYTFTMPASQVKVTATFTKTGEPTLPFTDVSEDNWAYGDIVYVYENGLMQGDSATIFDRLSSISRKEIVTILYRLAGEPAVAADNGFADVADGVWYADAVNWAVSEGITQGVGGNRFDPDAAITRQDLAVMLWRYAGEPAGGLSVLEGYRDEDSVSGYARAALAWAVEQGIVTGVGDSTLDPMGSAQRQQAAAMIRRLAERVQA